MTTGYGDRAALAVRAKYVLRLCDRGELLDILRRWIASFPPEKADAALVELFAEIDILDDVAWESAGYRNLTPEEIEEENRRHSESRRC